MIWCHQCSSSLHQKKNDPFKKKKKRKKAREREKEIKREIPTGLAFNHKLGSSVIQSDRDRPYCLGKLIPFCLRLSAIQPRPLKNLVLWCYTRQQGMSQVVFVSRALRVSGGFGSCVRLTWPGPGCGPVLLCPTLGVFVVQWKAGGRQRQRLVLHGPTSFCSLSVRLGRSSCSVFSCSFLFFSFFLLTVF